MLLIFIPPETTDSVTSYPTTLLNMTHIERPNTENFKFNRCDYIKLLII